jgi:hypothetical protein
MGSSLTKSGQHTYAVRMNGSRPATTFWFRSDRDAKLAFGALAARFRRGRRPGRLHLELVVDGAVVEELDLDV